MYQLARILNWWGFVSIKFSMFKITWSLKEYTVSSTMTSGALLPLLPVWLDFFCDRGITNHLNTNFSVTLLMNQLVKAQLPEKSPNLVWIHWNSNYLGSLISYFYCYCWSVHFFSSFFTGLNFPCFTFQTFVQVMFFFSFPHHQRYNQITFRPSFLIKLKLISLAWMS